MELVLLPGREGPTATSRQETTEDVVETLEEALPPPIGVIVMADSPARAISSWSSSGIIWDLLA